MISDLLIGRDIEFLPGVEDFNSYIETGMRATVVGIKEYPENGLFELSLSYQKFEIWNYGFETIRFTDRIKHQRFTHRDLNGYDAEESYCVSHDFDFFRLLDMTTDRAIRLN